jgi:putative ABC transport system substrate-binding protein
VKRRAFISLIGGVAAAWPLAARAQQSSLALVGVLMAGAATTLTKELDTFRDALRSLGHVEGRNVRFEYRFADGYLDRLPGLAAELVRLNPNIIVSSPMPANVAVAKATSTIPIVMASGADPVGFGLVKSLSHPGGNVTGLTNFAEELASKQIDLMRELLPRLARLAALVNVANPCTCHNGARPRSRLPRQPSPWCRSNSAALINSRRPLPRSAGNGPMRCWFRRT